MWKQKNSQKQKNRKKKQEVQTKRQLVDMKTAWKMIFVII